MAWYRASTEHFTAGVRTEDEPAGKFPRIVDAAPILKRFVGQPLFHLKRWLDVLGGTLTEISDEPDKE